MAEGRIPHYHGHVPLRTLMLNIGSVRTARWGRVVSDTFRKPVLQAEPASTGRGTRPTESRCAETRLTKGAERRTRAKWRMIDGPVHYFGEPLCCVLPAQ